jgi:hypothetical protein
MNHLLSDTNIITSLMFIPDMFLHKTKLLSLIFILVKEMGSITRLAVEFSLFLMLSMSFQMMVYNVIEASEYVSSLLLLLHSPRLE